MKGENRVRKMMTKEVTFTTIKVAKMEMVDGSPEAVALPDEVLIGNIRLERAQREMNKLYGEPVTVFSVEPETHVYEMAVEDFIKVAEVKEIV